MDLIEVIIIIAAYIIPTLIAMHRKASHLGGIVVLNLLLGWTFLGWVGALIWSVSDQRKPDNSPATRYGVVWDGTSSPEQSKHADGAVTSSSSETSSNGD